MNPTRFALGAALLLGTCGFLGAQAPHALDATGQARLVVDSQANIFASGHAQPGPYGGGQLPPGIVLPVGEGHIVRFPFIQGKWTCVVATPNLGPEGGNCVCGGNTDISGIAGISGIRHASRQMFLVGVFLSDAEPAEPAPVAQDATGIYDADWFAPGLRQTFFIGAGRTSKGFVQQFKAPKGATRLYLGVADSGCFVGGPGCYDDNRGQMEVLVQVGEQDLPKATTPPTPPPPDWEPIPAGSGQLPVKEWVRLLSGVGDAMINGRPSVVKARLIKIQDAWKRGGESVLKLCSPAEQERANRYMARLVKSEGFPAVTASLQLGAIFVPKLPAGYGRDIKAADRAILECWSRAEQDQWSQVRDPKPFFVPLFKNKPETISDKLLTLLKDNYNACADALNAHDKGKSRSTCVLVRRVLEEMEADR